VKKGKVFGIVGVERPHRIADSWASLETKVQ
jgi:hypothetical protein